MPNIYIPQEQRGKNLSAALDFGDKIISCLSQEYQIYSTVTDTVETIRRVLSVMKADDYLLLIGDPILIGLASTIAFENHDVVNFLKWDRQTRNYVPVSIDIISPMVLA